MNARNTDGLMQDGPGPAISRAWSQPRMSVLGEVSSLTETGSMISNESPYNLCLIYINMTGNTCMG